MWDASADAPNGWVWYLETDDDERLALIFDDAGTKKYDTLDPDTPSWSAGGSLTNLGTPGTGLIAGNLNPANFDDNGKYPCWNDGSRYTSLGSYLTVSTSTTIGTPAAVNTTDGYGIGAVIYRERAYYWGFNTKPGRIYYSDPADYSTVGATSSFDVNADVDSYAGAVVGMWSIKNALLIATKDNRWMVLTGTSPENGTLRELGKDTVPVLNTAAIVDNELFFLNPTAKGVVVATPSFVEARALEYLSPTAYPASTQSRPATNYMPQMAIGDEVTRSLFLPARNISNAADLVAVERVNDTWNLSRWDIDAVTPGDVFFTRGRPGQMWALVTNTTDFVPLSRDFTLNRPANSGDSRSQALGSESYVTGGSSVVVDLGEIEAGEGKILRPVKVVLDLDYWKGGNYSDPELAVDADILGTESDTSTDTLAQQTVTVTSWANTSGDLPARRRVPVALPQGQFGTAFRIRLTYDNLALDSVVVYYDEQDDPR